VGEAYFSVATDGTLAYASERSFSGALWFSRDGRRLATAIDAPIDPTLRASPDGRRIAAAVQDPDKASTDIVVVDVASGARSRLTSSPLWEQNPVWSPDGKQIAYRGAKDELGIYVKDAAGGNERLVARDPEQMQRPLDWSPNGTLLASRATARSTELVLIPIAGGPAVRLAETTGESGEARFSPDGRFVAYGSRETGSSQVHIRAVDRPIVVRVTTTGGSNPVWSRDGREIFYVDHESWIAAVPVRTTAGTVEVGAATRLMPRSGTALSSETFAFDVDRSGRFLMRTFEDDSRAGDLTMLNIIQNWTLLIAK
jgi:Tol biopolymer transport system component